MLTRRELEEIANELNLSTAEANRFQTTLNNGNASNDWNIQPAALLLGKAVDDRRASRRLEPGAAEIYYRELGISLDKNKFHL